MSMARRDAERVLINRPQGGLEDTLMDRLLDMVTRWLQVLYGKQQNLTPVIGNPEALKNLQLLQSSKRSEPAENTLIYRPGPAVAERVSQTLNIWRGDFKFVVANSQPSEEKRPPVGNWQNLLFNQDTAFKG